MRKLACAIAAVSLLAAPMTSSAQSTNEPLTRAQVRDDLIAVEQAGYSPAAANDDNYPQDIQAAEARIAAQRQMARGMRPATVRQ